MTTFTWDDTSGAWNGTNITFSNGASSHWRTATRSGGGGNTYRSGRSFETIAPGQDIVVSCTLSALGGGMTGDTLFGLCNASESFTTGRYIGISTNSISIDTAGQKNYGGGGATATLLGAFGAGTTVYLDVHRSSSPNYVRFSYDGVNWSPTNYPITTLGDMNSIYLGYTVYYDGDAWTLPAASGGSGAGSATQMMMGV